MGLVGIGLVLVLVQIVGRRSHAWLVARAVLVALTLLYAWCLADVAAMIASFNVAYSSTAGGAGPELDIDALLDLGPDALPAVDRYLATESRDSRRSYVQSRRDAWACHLRQEADEWRRWSVRAWRLRRYLDRMGDSGPVPERCPDADAQD